MKGIIIFKGKYGATSQYAEWIAEETGLPVVASHAAIKGDLINNDLIVLGSSVYTGALVMGQWIRENQESLLGKKIYLFVVCGTPMDKLGQLENNIRAGLPGQIREQCVISFLPGKMNYKKLSWSDKFLIRVAGIFSAITGGRQSKVGDFNEVKKENIKPLLQLLTGPFISPKA